MPIVLDAIERSSISNIIDKLKYTGEVPYFLFQ